jgi:hypothetical protein
MKATAAIQTSATYSICLFLFCFAVGCERNGAETSRQRDKADNLSKTADSGESHPLTTVLYWFSVNVSFGVEA